MAPVIYCTQKFDGPAMRMLAEGTRQHRLVMASQPNQVNLNTGPAEAALSQADVAFGQPDVRTASTATCLRWIHLTTAGYERYAGDDFRTALAARGAALTTSSSGDAEPVAQHTMAQMLMLARQLPASIQNQREARTWPAREIRAASRLLTGQTAVILGFGAIARRLVELLAPYRMGLVAVRTRPRGDEPIRTVAPADMATVLPPADHVINTLPGGPDTFHFINATHLAAMKPGAILYNVGRGTTVDQDALATALSSGRLAAACLDVMDPEPLPPDHPLWRAPNCWITPHTAGGHDDEFTRIVAHFLENLRRFDRGGPLLDRVI